MARPLRIDLVGGWYHVTPGATKVRPCWLTRETVLGLLGPGNNERRMQAYRQGVEKAVREGLEVTPWEQLMGGVVLGSARLMKVVRERLPNAPQCTGLKDYTQRHQLASEPRLSDEGVAHPSLITPTLIVFTMGCLR
ncbi:MAG: hypothetical protein EXS18_00145 [Verrucomicrobiae bacterium]|nr:hypothetical protein [Verrucomicrobiae bacterium]